LTVLLYSLAHSDPKKGPGATTIGGLTEQELAEDVAAGIQTRLANETGITLERFGGSVRAKVDRMRTVVRAMQRLEMKYASLEVHFNMPPTEHCHRCGHPGPMGVVCRYCGRLPDRPWRLGHTALVSRWAPSSHELADCVLDAITEALPWSQRQAMIMLPDQRYGTKDWPERMWPPAALIECGFGCDPEFSDYVTERVNRLGLGVVIANGVLRFLEQTDSVAPKDWGRVYGGSNGKVA